ncbi:hypothetical protein [Listeria seeligeri]|uniref:hypothetical protein n=1 Tax=Listeria seeligeri TaxID=1640 RepID=UPI00162391FE|nr:hypothetical protein [Listeria seeligeri]MBC1527434.1 hypothetical protein [Listeria seeligeri]MBC1731653.1 hypothetical protein [Listeria seeligeri]MBC1809480.1 hypothetical protein [Listeria seeligeri]MBC1894278.1 hypothetical protein [Listeria seeligeri]MBC1931885.1 hypothetical protein [Listeria seeligeri]
MAVENEIRKLFKERYLENLLQFLKEDEDYQIIRDKIMLAQDEIIEVPTQNNKEKLHKLKDQLAEYVHITIFEIGFLEGVNYQSELNTI